MQISKMLGQTVVKTKTWESDLGPSAYPYNFEVLVRGTGLMHKKEPLKNRRCSKSLPLDEILLIATSQRILDYINLLVDHNL